jgi:hypothetical protein
MSGSLPLEDDDTDRRAAKATGPTSFAEAVASFEHLLLEKALSQGRHV